MAAVKTFPKTQAVPERSTYQYQVVLTKVNGEALEAAHVGAIYLSLRDLRNDAIVNSRDQVQVKDANGGTVTEGLFAMQFEDEDLQAIGDEDLQPRLLTIDIRLVGGGRNTREIVFWIKSMEDVEAVA